MDKELLYTQFDNVFFEKTRLSILTLIYKEELISFNRLKKLIGGTDGAIYTHLQKLQDAKYIAQKKNITGSKLQTFYYLTKQGKKLFRMYLEFLEDIVSSSKVASDK